MDARVTVAAIGLIGIGISAIFGGIGYFLKTRDERLSTKRKILFFLLEIRHALPTEYFGAEIFVEQYADYCNAYLKKKGLGDLGPIPPEIATLICNHFTGIIGYKRKAIETEILQPFSESLIELAEEHPILAYKIKGKEAFGRLIQGQSEYARDLREIPAMSQNEMLSNIIPSQILSIKKDSFLELVTEINDCIKGVSLQCGIISYLNVLIILRRPIDAVIDFSGLGLDGHLDKCIDAMTSSASNLEKQFEGSSS